MGSVFFNLNKKFFSRSSELRGIFSSSTVSYGCAGDLEGAMRRRCARRLGADVRAVMRVVYLSAAGLVHVAQRV